MKTDHYGQVVKNSDGSTTEETSITELAKEPPLSDSERRLVWLSDVTDEILDLVENEVGMGCGAWDMVPPKEIIAASWNFLPKTSSSCTRP